MRRACRVMIDSEGVTQIERMIAEGGSAGSLSQRAQIVKMAAAGSTNREIAKELGITEKKAARWRRRFQERGVEGLRSGVARPPRRTKITASTIRRVVELTLHESPAPGVTWTSRGMAAATGISEASVRRIWREHLMRPEAKQVVEVEEETEETFRLRAMYLHPCGRILALARRAGAKALLPKKEGLAVRDATSILLRMLLRKASGGSPGCAEREYRLDELLERARRESAGLELVIVHQGLSQEGKERICSWATKHPDVLLHFVGRYEEWVELLESVVETLVWNEQLADLGNSIERHLIDGAGEYAWIATGQATTKAQSAHSR